MLMRSKLILLEGISGSGKSSAGDFVQGLLHLQGLAVRFWREGDFDHPADFEGVVQFYAMRQKLEVELLAGLPLPSLVIEHAGQEWERCNAEIVRFVGAHAVA